MTILVEQMVEPWKNVIEIDPRLEQIETNSQFAQIISPNEIIALITLNVRIGKVEGLLNVCIPYISIESIMDKLNTKYWFSSMQETDREEYSEFIERQIANTKVPLSAVLGRSFISVNDFVNLQIGDIIKLDTKINGEVEVQVGNIHKFKGKAGLSDKKNAVMITEILRKEDE